MILVSTGTNEAQFDRLLRAVDALRLSEPILVQHGASSVRPAAARCVDLLPYWDFVDAVRRANVVVVHAGVGSVATVLAAGKRPVVVPRLKRYGEAVDDHQLGFARALAELGIADVVEDPASLADALSAYERRPPAEIVAGPLVSDLTQYLSELLDRPERDARAAVYST